MAGSDSTGQWTAGAAVATASDGCGARDAATSPAAATEIRATKAVAAPSPTGEDGRVDVAWIRDCLVRTVATHPDCGADTRVVGMCWWDDLARAPTDVDMAVLMKAYVATTGLLFFALVAAHVFRLVPEPQLVRDPWFVAATLIALAMSLWALLVFRTARRSP